MKTTTEMVSRLRNAAAEAGDLVQIVICDRAMGGSDTADDYMPPQGHERAGFARALEMSEAEAWAECERVIATDES